MILICGLALVILIASVVGWTQGSVDLTRESMRVVALTPAAVAKFRNFLRAAPGGHIRLAIIGDAHTGFTYDLQVESSPIASDAFVDRSHGSAMVVSPRDSRYVNGATIDWEIRGDGTAGFKFDNPNATKDSGE